MSDRQNEVLNAIDATLSGYTEDDPISYDAMRWSPEKPEEDTNSGYVGEYARLRETALERVRDVTTVPVYDHIPPRRPVDRFSFTRAAGSDSIPARLSPGEAMIPGPNGPIHIRGAYGNEPAQITEIDLDDIEGEQQ